MGIPVAVPVVPLPITDGINTSAEALLVELLQVIKNGTSVAAITTPATLIPDPDDRKSLIPYDAALASQQLFFRQLLIIIAKALASVGGTFTDNETPSGVINGTDGTDGNPTFTLAYTPTAGSLILAKNGVIQILDVDFTISTNTITFTGGTTYSIPISGNTLRAWYRY